MPYVLIPEGHKLEKATKLQIDAVNAKRRHDDVVALLTNPNTPLVLGGLVTAFFGARLAGDIISDLEDKVGAVSDDIKEGITDTVAKAEKEIITDPQNWVATQLTGLIALGAKIREKTQVPKGTVFV
jgi:hypothetical protein